MTHLDVVNLARGGNIDGEKTAFEKGTWRYVVYTPPMCCVFAFEDNFSAIVFVTAWRN